MSEGGLSVVAYQELPHGFPAAGADRVNQDRHSP